MRILILAPHPDDELLAFHYRISDWLKHGYFVKVLYCTGDGARQAEAKSYLSSCFNDSLSYGFLGLPDGKLLRPWLLLSLLRLVRQEVESFKPDVVLAPHWLEPVSITQDHLACFLASASLANDDIDVGYYCIWANVRKGRLPAPRRLWRRLKWRLRSVLLPWPKGSTLYMTEQETEAKRKMFYEHYKSQSHMPEAVVNLLCSEETLYTQRRYSTKMWQLIVKSFCLPSY